MPDPYVPDDIRDFIVKHIDSVAQLEALLLVCSNLQPVWRLSEIAARLYTSEADAAEALDRLCAIGLLDCSDGSYRPAAAASPEAVALIRKLGTTYARHLIPVTNIIHAKPRRIRSFADAFRFRKDR